MPDSPRIRTVLRVGATRAISLYSSIIDGALPVILPETVGWGNCSLNSGGFSKARLAAVTTSSICNGLEIISHAPSREASTAVSSVPKPVTKITGQHSRIVRSKSKPVLSEFKLMSLKIKSNVSVLARCNAWSGVSVKRTCQPCFCRIAFNSIPETVSSSTTKIFFIVFWEQENEKHLL